MASFLEQLMTQNFWVQLLSAYHFSILVTAKREEKKNQYPIRLQTIFPLFQSQFLYPRKTL